MKMDLQELRVLLGLLRITEAEEINCEEFLRLTPGYLEELRQQGEPSVERHQSFLHHLTICPECQEEFEALCAAMRDGIL